MVDKYPSLSLNTDTALADALDEERDELAGKLPARIQHDPHLEGMHRVSERELKSLASYILSSAAGHLRGDRDEWNRCYTFVVNACFCLSLPLLETAYILYMLRDSTLDHLGLDEHAATEGAVPDLLQFFDRLVLEVLRRY